MAQEGEDCGEIGAALKAARLGERAPDGPAVLPQPFSRLDVSSWRAGRVAASAVVVGTVRVELEGLCGAGLGRAGRRAPA